jgi:SAM-dependent methyltransferase
LAREAAVLLATAAAPYRAAGRFAWHFARGKLRHDPVFAALLRSGVIPPASRIADLGCGQGVLFALLDAAVRAHAGGDWPPGWPDPPRAVRMWGVDLRADAIRLARVALHATGAVFEEGDLRTTPIPASDVIVLMDVLHYLPAAAQEDLVDRIVAALAPGGLFITRVGDAAAGWRALATRCGDWIVTVLRGTPWPRFHCRPLDEWQSLLARRGLRVEATPMSQGTPFANVLLVAHKVAAVTARSREATAAAL